MNLYNAVVTMTKMKQNAGDTDMSLAGHPASTIDKFSFENYFACKFGEAAFDRRGACLVCRKATGSAVKYDTQDIHCHKSCLNLLLFYEFLNHVEVKLFEANSNNASSKNSKVEELSLSLDELLDARILTKYAQGERIKCCACGLKHAYFKCAVEHCPNFIHENCSDNGSIVVNVGDSASNGPHYRFLVCSEHLGLDYINMVKCRFLSKLSLTTQYKEAFTEFQQLCKVRGHCLGQQQTALPNQKEVPRQGRPCTTTYSGRTVCPPKRLDNFMTSTSNNGTVTRSSGVANANDKTAIRGGARNQQINTLMVEYSSTRKQKTPKKIEWWHYDILFTPLHPEIFECGGEKARNASDAEMHDDICAMFDCKWSFASATDLKRVLAPCECAMREVCNAVALHLNPQSTFPFEGSIGSDASCSSSITGEISGGEMEAEADGSIVANYTNGTLQNEALCISGVSLTPYAFHMDHSRHDLVGFGSCRPKFVLANLGSNRAAWFSCALTKRRETRKILLLEYMPLSLLASEYLRRILRFTLVLNSDVNPNATTAVPILYKQRKALPKEETLKNQSDAPSSSKVNFCGFTWDEVPPLYKLFSKALEDGETILTDATLDHNIVNGCNESTRKVDWNSVPAGGIDRADITDLIAQAKQIENVFGPVEEHGFVARQTIALLLALNSVQRALDVFKARLKEKIETEAPSYGRRHKNVAFVEQYRDAAEHMRRWSHFRRAFVQSIDKCNYAMEMEKSQGTLGEGGKMVHSSVDDASENKSNPASDASEAAPMKEYCSICLLSELSRKHALMQCAKCCIRVHNRCYGTYTAAVPTDDNDQKSKHDEANSVWFCEPCKYESNLTQKVSSSCNTAICCICCSSAGAMKRVAASDLLSKRGMTPYTLWVHLHCVVFFMPAVSCQDWSSLSMWDLRSLRFTMDKCDICTVNGGVLLECAEKECKSRFHPTCAWMSGCHLEHSFMYNSCLSASLLKTDCDFKEIFPSICVGVHCLDHSRSRFSATIVARQREQRCFAYTHYQHQPDGYGYGKERSQYHDVPLNQVYSPVSVTRDGPTKTPQGTLNVAKNGPEYLCKQERPRVEYLSRPIGVTNAPPGAALSVARPRYRDMNHTSFGVVAAKTMPEQKPGPPVYYGFTFPFTMEPPKYGIHAITSYLTKSNMAPQPPLRPSGRKHLMLKPHAVPLVMPAHHDVRMNGHPHHMQQQQQHPQQPQQQHQQMQMQMYQQQQAHVQAQQMAHAQAQQMAHAQYLQQQQQHQQAMQMYQQQAHAQAQQLADAQYWQHQQQHPQQPQQQHQQMQMQMYQQQQAHIQAQQMAHAQYLQQQQHQQAMQMYQQQQAAMQAHGITRQSQQPQRPPQRQQPRQNKQRQRQSQQRRQQPLQQMPVSQQQLQMQMQQQWNQAYGPMAVDHAMALQHLVPPQSMPMQPQIMQPHQLPLQHQQQQPKQQQQPSQPRPGQGKDQGQGPYGFDGDDDQNNGIMYINTQEHG